MICAPRLWACAQRDAAGLRRDGLKIERLQHELHVVPTANVVQLWPAKVHPRRRQRVEALNLEARAIGATGKVKGRRRCECRRRKGYMKTQGRGRSLDWSGYVRRPLRATFGAFGKSLQ